MSQRPPGGHRKFRWPKWEEAWTGPLPVRAGVREKPVAVVDLKLASGIVSRRPHNVRRRRPKTQAWALEQDAKKQELRDPEMRGPAFGKSWWSRVPDVIRLTRDDP